MKKLLLMFALLFSVCAFAATNTGTYSALNTNPAYWWLPGNLWHHRDQTNNKGVVTPPPAVAKSESASPEPAQVINSDNKAQGEIIMAIVLFVFVVALVVACLPKRYNDQ